MIEYLITGCGGFVGFHYLKHLESIGCQRQIVGIGTTAPSTIPENIQFDFYTGNLLDADHLARTVKQTTPRFCVHLAAKSSVAASWSNPAESVLNNTNIFLNLVEAIRKHSPETRILSVGSSEQYGSRPNDDSPLKESDRLSPESPYAVAKCAQE